MKMFKIAMLALMMSVGSVYAQSVDISTLPAEKQAEINKMIDAAKGPVEKATETVKQVAATAEKVSEVVSPEKMSEYQELGSAIGDSVAAAAEKITKVGIDFANSWFGKMAIFMIVWKLMLGAVLSSTFKVILSISWGYTVLATWKHYFNKLCVLQNEYTRTFKRMNVETKEYEDVVETGVEYNHSSVNDDRKFMMIIILAIALTPSAALLIAAF